MHIRSKEAAWRLRGAGCTLLLMLTTWIAGAARGETHDGTGTGSESAGRTGIFNAKAYGAQGDGKADDTDALQRTIDAATAPPGGIAYVPPGTYRFSSLNLTDRLGLTVEGAGQQATTLVTTAQEGAALDLTGGQYITLRRLQLRVAAEGSPAVGILMAASTGEKASPSTSNHLEQVAVSNPEGRFTLAGVLLYASGDHVFMHTNFHIIGGKPALLASGRNDYGVRSKFARIYEGDSYVSDCTFTACEFHSNGAGGEPTIVLRRTSQMRWLGGPISNSGQAQFAIRDGATQTAIYGSTLYSESGTPPPHSIRIEDTIEVNGLTLDNANVQCTRGVLGGAAGARLTGITLLGTVTVAGAPAILDFPPAEAPGEFCLKNALLHCGGLALRPTGSIAHTVLIQPGGLELPPGATARAEDGVGKF